MPLFKKNEHKLKRIKENPFKKEKELQRLTEKNLKDIFGLDFVATEFQVENLYIDTLGHDPENKSFVIVEYKRDKSFSVVDQGFSYLSLMLQNKADFVLTYNEAHSDVIRKNDIDWSQSRVIFIARSYTAHQKNAVNFKGLAFELWEASQYENDLIQYKKVETSNNAESIKKINPLHGKAEKVVNELKSYTEEDFIGNSGDRYDLYQNLKEKILQIDESLVVNPKQDYIAFQPKDQWRNLLYVRKIRGGLLLHFTRSKPEDFNDPKEKLVYLSKDSNNKGNDITELKLTQEKDIQYAQMLVQQAYERFVSEFGN